MRDLTNSELQKIYIEQDMIKGNISRICIVDDIDEFIKNTSAIVSSLNKIFNICAERFKESK